MCKSMSKALEKLRQVTSVVLPLSTNPVTIVESQEIHQARFALCEIMLAVSNHFPVIPMPCCTFQEDLFHDLTGYKVRLSCKQNRHLLSQSIHIMTCEEADRWGFLSVDNFQILKEFLCKLIYSNRNKILNDVMLVNEVQLVTINVKAQSAH